MGPVVDARHQRARLETRVTGLPLAKTSRLLIVSTALVCAFASVSRSSATPEQKTGTTPSTANQTFGPSEFRILILHVQAEKDEKEKETKDDKDDKDDKNEHPFERAIVSAAHGWTVYRDLKSSDGATRTYVLLGDGSTNELAAPADFVDAVSDYLATPAGNLLEADASISLEPSLVGGGTEARSDSAHAEGQASDWSFAGDAGLVLCFVKAERKAEFESTLARVRSAVESARNSDPRAYAGWRVVRMSAPTPSGALIYALVVAPADPESNYAFGATLAKDYAGPDLRETYAKYADAVISANLFDLARVEH
jgi:hypothetical protein